MDKKVVAVYVNFVQTIAGGWYPNEEMFPIREEDKEAIDSALESLNKEEGVGAHCAQILKLKFGLDGNGRRTLTEIGSIIGISKQSVGYWAQKSIRRLRHPGRGFALHRLYRTRLERTIRSQEERIRELETGLNKCYKQLGDHRRRRTFRRRLAQSAY